MLIVNFKRKNSVYEEQMKELYIKGFKKDQLSTLRNTSFCMLPKLITLHA